ncbi:MAG: pentapeptide repeat-containing protein [Acidobacteria bacterium]|nr:pentapeptide repeat-containing protein [Acidobacteriota bacterium]
MANLIRADLFGAVLSKANLSGANLGGANLGGADLGGAVLSGAKNLTWEQVSVAIIDDETRLPTEIEENNKDELKAMREKTVAVDSTEGP